MNILQANSPGKQQRERGGRGGRQHRARQGDGGTLKPLTFVKVYRDYHDHFDDNQGFDNIILMINIGNAKFWRIMVVNVLLKTN